MVTLGVEDLASEEPMSTDVHLRIGSVTKTFTVSLLLQPAVDGLLSLGDTMDGYIDGVHNRDEITLRQMADMTSGIAATHSTSSSRLSCTPTRSRFLPPNS